MTCVICKTGTIAPGHKTLTFEEGDRLVIIRAVPGHLCNNCGEFYTDAAQTKRVQERVKQSMAQGAEVEIVRL